MSENQEVKVRIIHIDPERRRMGLSMKQVDDSENWADYQAQEAAETSTPDSENDESMEA